MRQVLVGLLAGILVVLIGIGFELQTIARELNRLPVSSSISVDRVAAPAETREQRNIRLQREQHERELDALAIWNAPSAAKQKAPATPR